MPMYGTVARMRVKPGHHEQLLALGEERSRSAPDSLVNTFVLRTDADADEVWVLAVFRDRESYRQGAEDPTQNAFFQRQMEHLEGPPEWHDGEIIATARPVSGAA